MIKCENIEALFNTNDAEKALELAQNIVNKVSIDNSNINERDENEIRSYINELNLLASKNNLENVFEVDNVNNIDNNCNYSFYNAARKYLLEILKKDRHGQNI